jgi:glutamine amidotransferase PdxT
LAASRCRAAATFHPEIAGDDRVHRLLLAA